MSRSDPEPNPTTAIDGPPADGGKAATTGAIPRQLYTQLATVHLRDDGRSEAGSSGEYEVTIIFRHPVQSSGVDGTLHRADEIEGDSGIGLPGPAEFEITTGDTPPRTVRVQLGLNASGRLAKAVSRLQASSYGDARSTVYSHLGPLLSRLAFESDAPIDVFQVDVADRSTTDHDRAAILRGQTRRFATIPIVSVPPPFFRAAFGIYREGLNSTNPFYALLCFYRVAEGAIACGTSQSAYAVAHGVDPKRPAPVVEDLDEISRDFPETIGWRCTRTSTWLGTKYRVPVAHGLEQPLHAPDELLERDRYWRAVPLARQVARKLLDCEWQFRQKLGLDTIADLDS